MPDLNRSIDTETVFDILGTKSREHSQMASNLTDKAKIEENLRIAIAVQDCCQSVVLALGGEYEDYQEVYRNYFT